jgi:imidazolonepropionase
MWDSLFVDCQLATFATPEPYGTVRDGAIGVASGRIAFAGPRTQLSGAPERLARRVCRLGGAWVTPGLVDCHTHIIYAGSGVRDFEMRLAGATRAEIYAADGGVPGAVRRARAASDAALFEAAVRRVSALVAGGVTVIEIKSGFGLDYENELRHLRLARRLGRELPVTVHSTFLGAHGLPQEYAGRPDDYIDFLCNTVLPAAVAEDLVDAVDGFCDAVGFTHAQIARLFDTARAHGLLVKLHADQYTNFKAGQLAAEYGALSAEHLEYADEETVAALAASGTVAVLLPGANYVLQESQKPPVPLLRRHGVPMALATNCNPSSSPTTMPTMIMNLACTLFRMTPEEAVGGFTTAGARALRVDADYGTLAVGKAADLAVWDVESMAELPYMIARNPCVMTVRAGDIIYQAPPPFDVRQHVAARCTSVTS